MKALNVILTVPLLMLACQTVPDGFSPEAWERYQRENPNGAQVVKWVHESSARRDLKQKCLAASQAAVGKQEYAGIWFMDQAQVAMLQGRDLKQVLIERLQGGIENGERRLQFERQMNARVEVPRPENEVLNYSLRRDRAMLEAITR